MKTEFLVQLDGAGTNSEDRVLIVGATNRPQDLDEAVRRRLVKRLYIPLPNDEARKVIIESLMKQSHYELSDQDIAFIVKSTEGYSGADMKELCVEAALGPCRDIRDIKSIDASSVRPIQLKDFVNALKVIRPSVSQKDIGKYVEWNKTYGSFGT
jgi:SpoVK/Ycf46/Vps4 family AAA+-type ATPase